MDAAAVAEKYGYREEELPLYIKELDALLKFRSTPVSMKFFKDKKEMEAVPKIRIPKPGEIFTACQLVSQSARLNYTVGIYNDILTTLQCAGALGLIDPRHFRESIHLTGSWCATDEDSHRHQAAAYLPTERYQAVATSPVVSGRLKDPDVCLIYATPQQVLFMCCGLQYEDYESMTATLIGESSCTDSWIKALVTKKPCFTIPCFGERRFGGILEDELLMAMPPQYLPKMLGGIKRLSKNGMRYPAVPYGIQNDAASGMGAFYDLDALRRETTIKVNK